MPRLQSNGCDQTFEQQMNRANALLEESRFAIARTKAALAQANVLISRLRQKRST
jgi:hypothetical protein